MPNTSRFLAFLLSALLFVHLANGEEAAAPVAPPAGTPLAVPTFHCLGLYWSPPGGAADRAVQVRYRGKGAAQWSEGLPMRYNPINETDEDLTDYRGSIVHLQPATTYGVELTLATLTGNEQAILDVLVMRACQVLGPAEPPGPGFKFERIVRDFAGEFARISKLVLDPKGSEAALERWTRDSPQPVVMEDLAGTFFTVFDKLSGKQRPRQEAVLLILACIKAIVAELSRADPD
jgi:hypothetical protein